MISSDPAEILKLKPLYPPPIMIRTLGSFFNHKASSLMIKPHS
ncbi:MAG TPA: hypothetical protein VIP56_07650 [Nitrososphaeraceae archaeon]